MTITSFTGEPETRVAVVTETDLLTFLDPALRTQTLTFTTTSFFRRARRTVRTPPQTQPSRTPAIRRNLEPPSLVPTSDPVPKPTSTVAFRTKGRAEKRQDITLISTVTSIATVFARNIVTSTLTNTVFSTTTVAPNAVTTVVVTTTVFLPSASITSTTRSSTRSSPGGSSTSLSPSNSNTDSVNSPTRSSSTATRSSLSLSSPSSATSMTRTSITSTDSATMATMMTRSLSDSTPSPTTTPTLTPIPMAATFSLSSGQIAGIVLGAIIGLFLLLLAAYLLRRLVQKRRAAQAQMRQQLSTPSNPNLGGASDPAPGPIVPIGPGSSSNASSSPGGNSGLTGEGEVRIVIRPAPRRRTQSSQIWPMPPSQRGIVQQGPGQGQDQGQYSLFVEETTTGETTPQDPGAWSIASERGSLGEAADDHAAAYAGFGSARPSTSVTNTSAGAAGRDGVSVLSVGWDTSNRSMSMLGGGGSVSEAGSYPGLGTLLTPPPAPPPAPPPPPPPFRPLRPILQGGRADGDFTSSEGPDGSSDRGLSTRGTDATGGSGRSGGGGGGGGSGYPMGSFGIGRAW
ncbi:hypothetical protein MMYC01_209612 [Madurella mycetomatis]|uniref:Uncharacterized protein n=1 Tax=Madurella mycetomatis TaxID=100816 RepID=A0A175VVJ9_9PEZI|nr:hypothetical protein MMYC01_209612 [Madurella mycetomatis]